MKRSFRMISLFLVLTMLLAVVASCTCESNTSETTTPGTTQAPTPPEHTCSMQWTYNATEHWQACTVSGCLEKGEAAPHRFGQGTTTKDGSILTHIETCTVCKYQKTERGNSEVILTFDDLLNEIYDGAVSMANIDIKSNDSKDYYYFQTLSKKGTNTLRVKALESTTASFVVTSVSSGGRGSYNYVYKNLKVNGSSDSVTYSKGSPSFSGWDTPTDITVATITLSEGINEISFDMGADVGITGFKLQDLNTPVYVTDNADFSPAAITPLYGEGTEASPWLISSADDFIAMNEWIKYDAAYAKGYYKMTANIDFEGTEFVGINATIGFSGVFDGNGHVVKNLNIARINKNQNGLFSKVLGGTIKNLGIESGWIEGADRVGGLIGYADDATILNCFNEADVKGFNQIGGLAGATHGTKISNSFNKGTLRIAGRESIGGLVGLAKTTQIDNCYNVGAVGYSTYSGKLVGWTDNGIKLSNTYYNKAEAPENQPIGSLLTPGGAIGMVAEDFHTEAFVETMNKNLKDGYMIWAYGKDKIARLYIFEENNKIAIFMASVNSVTIKDGKVESLISEDGGYKTVVYGSDKKSVITLDGKVYQPLTNQTVALILDIVEIKSGNVVSRINRNIEVEVQGKYETNGTNACPNVVPGLREWYGLTGNFTVTANTRIVATTAAEKDLANRVQTYMKDMLGLTLTVIEGGAKDGDIVLKYNADRAAELGDEGNAIYIDNSIIIEAATETGLFYGAVSIMQILYQDETRTNVPKGYARDYPAYEMRGGMIDVSRKFFSLDYIEELGKYMSWFKLNSLHLHINDDSGERDSTFVVESKVYPEINKGNGENVWSQDDYRAMQKELKKFGVNVITEIDTPAHSGAFAQVPGAPVSGNTFQLNSKYDESLEFVKKLYDEFLDGDDPVIQNAYIHMGTDEVGGATNEVLHRYMSDLSQYLLAKDNVEKVIFWGNLTMYYGSTEINPENMAAQIWVGPHYRAGEAIAEGFGVINSSSSTFYLTPNYGQSFGDEAFMLGYADAAKLYDIWGGARDFQTHGYANPSDWFGWGYFYDDHEILKGEPLVLGALFANWNDQGLGYDYDLCELYLGYFAAISEKCWYGDENRFASGEKFKAAFHEVYDYTPYANPRYRVESDGSIIANYDFEETVDGAVKDLANGYHATIANGVITTQEDNKVLALNGTTSLKMPFKGVGYPYTANFKLYLDGKQEKNSILFTCDECTIYLDYEGKGVAFASGLYVYGFNVQIPTDEWVEIKITSQSPRYVHESTNITILSINGMEYIPTRLTNPTKISTPSRSTILGTVDTFLGVKGYVDDLMISNKYQFDSVVDAHEFEGKGTESSPYLIKTATDLSILSLRLNRGEYAGAHFKLTADIDMNGVTFMSFSEFTGVLDGNGHVITGITINQPDSEMVGFIGHLNGGTVKNLGLARITVVGGNRTGGLAGRSDKATVLNCFVIGTINGGSDVGGIIGMCNNTAIKNCFTAGSVTARETAGGIAGGVNASVSSASGIPVDFDNLYSIATVTAGNSNVGAIAGWEDAGYGYDTRMTNLYCTGSLNASGNYNRKATKLTEAQLKDGTLLNALNANTTSGYAKFVASGAGYPVFVGTDPDFTEAELPETPDDSKDVILENKTIDIVNDATLSGKAKTDNGYLDLSAYAPKYATYTVNGNYKGQYQLIIHYADPAGWQLNVQVNGVTHKQQIYGPNDGDRSTSTPSWDPADGTRTHTFIVDLVNGENTLIFGTDYWPMGSVAKFELVRVGYTLEEPETPDLPTDDEGHILYNTGIDIVNDATLSGSADTSKGYLDLSARGEKYATYTVSGNYEGQYQLIIHYADPAGWQLNVQVNGVTHNQQIYGPNDGDRSTSTPSFNPEDGTRTHTFIVNLVNGENTLIFGTAYWPMGSVAKIELVRVSE